MFVSCFFPSFLYDNRKWEMIHLKIFFFLLFAELCRPTRFQRMPAEDEDSCPVILDRDFHSLHRNVPALRRRDVDTTAIRQHYYPEGGWGWIICGTGFIVHLFTTGLQLSFGLLYLHTLHHIGDQALMDTGELFLRRLEKKNLLMRN